MTAAGRVGSDLVAVMAHLARPNALTATDAARKSARSSTLDATWGLEDGAEANVPHLPQGASRPDSPLSRIGDAPRPQEKVQTEGQ